MYIEKTPKELIKILGLELYNKTLEITLRNLLNGEIISKEVWGNYCFDIVGNPDYKTLVIEAQAIFSELNDKVIKTGGYATLEIQGLWLSDEDMPDELLDRMNELRRICIEKKLTYLQKFE